jgi:hypothetical protein
MLSENEQLKTRKGARRASEELAAFLNAARDEGKLSRAEVAKVNRPGNLELYVAWYRSLRQDALEGFGGDYVLYAELMKSVIALAKVPAHKLRRSAKLISGNGGSAPPRPRKLRHLVEDPAEMEDVNELAVDITDVVKKVTNLLWHDVVKPLNVLGWNVSQHTLDNLQLALRSADRSIGSLCDQLNKGRQTAPAFTATNLWIFISDAADAFAIVATRQGVAEAIGKMAKDRGIDRRTAPYKRLLPILSNTVAESLLEFASHKTGQSISSRQDLQ